MEIEFFTKPLRWIISTWFRTLEFQIFERQFYDIREMKHGLLIFSSKVSLALYTGTCAISRSHGFLENVFLMQLVGRHKEEGYLICRLEVLNLQTILIIAVLYNIKLVYYAIWIRCPNGLVWVGGETDRHQSFFACSKMEIDSFFSFIRCWVATSIIVECQCLQTVQQTSS